MAWYSLLKVAESYTSQILALLKQKLGLDVRFAMFHGTGSSAFVHFNNDLFEVRIEPARGANPNIGNGAVAGPSLGLLQQIENSGIFDRVRQESARPSFRGIFQPPSDIYTTPSRLEYMISVIHWKSSPYRSYFEQAMMPSGDNAGSV